MGHGPETTDRFVMRNETQHSEASGPRMRGIYCCERHSHSAGQILRFTQDDKGVQSLMA